MAAPSGHRERLEAGDRGGVGGEEADLHTVAGVGVSSGRGGARGLGDNGGIIFVVIFNSGEERGHVRGLLLLSRGGVGGSGL